MSLHVIILAAGQGTRMRSQLPKVLHPIGGKPLLMHVVEAAQAIKADAIHVVYGHGGELVSETLDDTDVNWVLQEQQLGTGHAVAQVVPYLGDNDLILVLYGDVPLISPNTLNELVALTSTGTLALLTAYLDEPMGYGRIVRASSGDVERIVEEKDAKDDEKQINEINTGILAVSAKHLHKWIKALDNNNVQGEYYLTDIIAAAVNDGVGISTVQAQSNYEIYGVNSRAQLAVLEREYQRLYADRLMGEGVTLVDPMRIDIRGELTVGQDSIIDINAIFEGEVTLGSNVKIGPNNLLRNSTIADNVEILSNCVIEDAIINSECRIGPFARIRPGTRLENRVNIGNFVEIKKADIAEGSKVNHLSYVGDASVGKDVNIGAGTITCNYDGANKHQTIIGDRVFVGSDSQLIAPLTIGDDATIAAGTTVTRNVPQDVLVVSRKPQEIISGWQRPVKKSKPKTS